MNVAQVQQLPVVAAEDAERRQLEERIAVLTRELSERETPPDVARMQQLERTLLEVLEWLDGLVGTAEDERLGIFCEGLAGRIRETMYGGKNAAG